MKHGPVLMPASHAARLISMFCDSAQRAAHLLRRGETRLVGDGRQLGDCGVSAERSRSGAVLAASGGGALGGGGGRGVGDGAGRRARGADRAARVDHAADEGVRFDRALVEQEVAARGVGALGATAVVEAVAVLVADEPAHECQHTSWHMGMKVETTPVLVGLESSLANCMHSL